MPRLVAVLLMLGGSSGELLFLTIDAPAHEPCQGFCSYIRANWGNPWRLWTRSMHAELFQLVASITRWLALTNKALIPPPCPTRFESFSKGHCAGMMAFLSAKKTSEISQVGRQMGNVEKYHFAHPESFFKTSLAYQRLSISQH